MQPYRFPQKREESYDLVACVRRWFAGRADVAAIIDLQDDPQFFYRGDLAVTRGDGRIQYIEVKCESSYTRVTTENLAIERYSSVGHHKPGGPWGTDADFFAHVYADGLLVIMNRLELVEWLERELAADPNAFPYRAIPNATWTTGTLLVPRSKARRALGTHYREYEVSVMASMSAR